MLNKNGFERQENIMEVWRGIAGVREAVRADLNYKI